MCSLRESDVKRMAVRSELKKYLERRTAISILDAHDLTGLFLPLVNKWGCTGHSEFVWLHRFGLYHEH